MLLSIHVMVTAGELPLSGLRILTYREQQSNKVVGGFLALKPLILLPLYP